MKQNLQMSHSQPLYLLFYGQLNSPGQPIVLVVTYSRYVYSRNDYVKKSAPLYKGTILEDKFVCYCSVSIV